MMEKFPFLILASCFLLFLATVECIPHVKATQTWIVGTDDSANFRTIQEAIDNATSGDTIIVRRGVYTESVVVNKSLFLLGEGANNTIVDGRGIDSVIEVVADNVTVNGFGVRNSGTDPQDSAIRLENSSGCTLDWNRIFDSYEGISLNYSSNNVVSDNVVTDSYDGISLSSSSSNTISGNTVSSNNFFGIALYYSSNNVISGNTVSSNSFYGASAFYSSNNVIYHNNFNNTNQVFIGDSSNTWNYDSEGNYWSSYNGQDLNEDGIGDSPHVIDEHNQDNTPLMGVFSDFDVSLTKGTYDVQVISNSTVTDFRFEIGAETGNRIIRFNAAGQNGSVGFSRTKIPTELMNYSFVVLAGEEETSPALLNISSATYSYLYLHYAHSNLTISIISSETLHLYNQMIDRYLALQAELSSQNKTISNLQANYTQLAQDYGNLNATFQERLRICDENADNIRNLMYILAATTAIFLMTTVYLSKRVHEKKKTVEV